MNTLGIAHPTDKCGRLIYNEKEKHDKENDNGQKKAKAEGC